MANYVDVTSPEQLKEQLSKDLNRVSLLSFWADWAAPCKEMNATVQSLAAKYPSVLVLSIEAESQSEIAESFDIESVPTLIFLRGHSLLQRITGADSNALTAAFATHGKSTPRALSSTTENSVNEKAPEEIETPEQLTQRLTRLMNMDKRVLFMKGNPEGPRCGFSRQFVSILKERNVAYSYFDIHTDESVRQGLKVLNNWPTFPQFIVNGEFIGGLDVVKELIENDEFDEAADLKH